MHPNERDNILLRLLAAKGFATFKEIHATLDSSPATIRRDLDRLENGGKILRVRGGASLPDYTPDPSDMGGFHLAGLPFDQNVVRNRRQKSAIGLQAAMSCEPGEAIMIDGGSTTLQMCSHLRGLGLSVLTNSIYVVSALIRQSGTRVFVPSGAVFPEQNLILPLSDWDGMPQFEAEKLFMGAAALGEMGLMQMDPVLVAAERGLIAKAKKIIVLADATKFSREAQIVVCDLEKIDTIITDDRISDRAANIIEAAGINLQIAVADTARAASKQHMTDL
jgi:DeoR family ulaG and ulaABCDEF operon transcriptional repressor